MRRSIVVAACLCILVGVSFQHGWAIEEVVITIQGRLTDGFGNPVADGIHTATVTFKNQDGTPYYYFDQEIQTKDGLFTKLFTDVPMDVFQCNTDNLSCSQILVITMAGQVAFPDIVMSNAGRAAVTARVNGDIQTSPGQVEVPSHTQFVDRKTIIKNDAIQLLDDNGDLVIDINTAIDPGHPEPTCVLNNVSTRFNGRTAVKGGFHVDSDGDAADDFTCNVVDGFKIFEQPLTCDCDGDGIGEFNIDQTGNARFFCNADGLPDLELLTTGQCNLHNTGWACDRNNDGIADINFLSDGTCNFNSDADLVNELSLTALSLMCRAPLKVDATGNGYAEFVVGDPAGQLLADLDEDFTTELAVTSTETTLHPALIVDASNAGPGSALLVTNASCKINPGEEATPEVNVTSGLTEITGDFKVDNFGSGTHFRVVSGNAIFQGTEINLDSDGDGVVTTSFGEDNSFISGNLNVDVDNNLSTDFSISDVAGTPTVTINGNLNVTGTKNFVQADPTDPTREIVYVALESGEAGTYTRGSAALHHGTAVVELPAHFCLVTNSEGLTAQITPRGPVHAMLYVESVTTTELVVKGSSPADDDVPFDYLINGVRRGFEELPVVRPRHTLATAGS